MTGLAPPHERWDAETATPPVLDTLAAAGYRVVRWLEDTADVTRHGTLSSSKDGCCARTRQEGAWRNTSALRGESEMAKRKTLSAKTRFEVFKRDKFTCQYCGEAAPKVVLHVDHVKPVAGGGDNNILNLITACQDCNGGKGARRLDDGSEVQKQQAQLADLQARREQIEMMLQWREALKSEKQDAAEIVAREINKYCYRQVNDNGRLNIRRWLKRFPLEAVLDAVNTSFDQYLSFNQEKVDTGDWEKAFLKVPAIAAISLKAKEKPYLPRLFYIQGILRKRFRDDLLMIDDLERCAAAGATVESLEECAKRAKSIAQFRFWLDDFHAKNGGAE
jgi:5-methylcytosine-specific restriction endonuclease McrA